MARDTGLRIRTANGQWFTNGFLLDGSSITNGYAGQIFEDSKGYIWVGSTGGFQVLSWETGTWTRATDNTGLMAGSISSSNWWGIEIFEDSDGNMWSTAAKNPLQVRPAGSNIWTTSHELLNGSLINNGAAAQIFQDLNGVLWAGGTRSPLQYYDKATKTWKTDVASGVTDARSMLILKTLKKTYELRKLIII